MSKVWAFIKAVRYKNLLIIVLTQYLMRFAIIKPFLAAHELDSQISEWLFALLVLSTVLVAAGGYLINDYFDLKIDRINKPNKILIGTHIKRRVAIVSHWIIHALGVGIGGFVAYKVGVWQLVLIHVFMVLAMWFYSTDFKRQLILGNLIIALSLALVPLMVVLFEVPALNQGYAQEVLEHPETIPFFKDLLQRIFYWVLGFSGFAFFFSLAREITKDAADVVGDAEYGCTSIPIKYGYQATKWTVSVIYLGVIASIIYLQQTFLFDRFSFLYMLIFIIPSMVITLYFTFKANDQKGFIMASLANKTASVIGLGYALIAYYNLIQLA